MSVLYDSMLCLTGYRGWKVVVVCLYLSISFQCCSITRLVICWFMLRVYFYQMYGVGAPRPSSCKHTYTTKMPGVENLESTSYWLNFFFLFLDTLVRSWSAHKTFCLPARWLPNWFFFAVCNTLSSSFKNSGKILFLSIVKAEKWRRQHSVDNDPNYIHPRHSPQLLQGAISTQVPIDHTERQETSYQGNTLCPIIERGKILVDSSTLPSSQLSSHTSNRIHLC